jgi:hypothetical protein
MAKGRNNVNTNLKIALAFVAGCVIGGSIVRSVMTEKCMEAYDLGWQDRKDTERTDELARLADEEEQAEIERERLQQEEAEEAFRSDPANEVVEGPDGPTYKDQVEDITVGAVETLIEKQGYTQYNKPVAPKGPTVITPAIPELPVLITFEEFDNTPADYEQYVLTLYMGNNKLVSQSGKVISGVDLVRTVGDLLGNFADGDNAIWIRNPKLKMDFEVVRDPKSFDEDE